MNQINGNGGAAPGPNQFQQLGMHHHLADPQQQNQQAMGMNNFDHGMATSVSFASVQSLCDVLRELPLPSAAVPKSIHTKTLIPAGLNASIRTGLLNDLSIIPQIHQALYMAKQQVTEIQFLDSPFQETFCPDSNIMPSNEQNTPSQPMNSNLIRTLAGQDMFYNQPAQSAQTNQQMYGANSQQTQQSQILRPNAPNATPGSSNSNMSGNLGDFNSDLGGIEPSIGGNMSDIQLMDEFIGDCDIQSSAMHSNNSNDGSRNASYPNNQHHQQQQPQNTTPISHHSQPSSHHSQQQGYQQAHQSHPQQQQQAPLTPHSQHVSQKNSMQSPHVQNNDHYNHQQQHQQNNQHYNNNGGYDHVTDDSYGSLGDRVKNRQREAAAKANHANASSFSYSSPSSSVYSSQHTPQHQLTPQHTPPVHQQPQQPPQQQQPQQLNQQHLQQTSHPQAQLQQQPQQQVSQHNQNQNNFYQQQNNFEKSNQLPAVKNEVETEFENNQYQQSKRMKIEHVPTYVVPPPPPPSQTSLQSWQQRKQPPPRQRTGIEHKPQIRAVKYEFTDSEYSDALLMNESVDIVVRFEQIIDSILAASCNSNSYSGYDEDEEDGDGQVNGMSFNVKIDSRQLKEIFVLSAKLKQASRVVEIERKKVILFMTVLSNQLSIWLTRYKTKASATSNPDGCDIHDLKEREQYWELCCNACQSALHIMTSAAPNRDPTALISLEESIDPIIDFLSHNLNSATHVSTDKPAKGKAKQQQFNLTKKHVTRWTQLLQLLFEFITMRTKGTLNESFILVLTRISMSALFLLNNTPEMQFASIEIACHIFEEYPNHRMAIFEELNGSLSKIQIKKTQKKNFVLTQILIKLSNAFFQPITNNESGQMRGNDVASLNTQFEQAMKYLSGFLSILLKRCANQSSNSDTDFKAILEVLLNDLLDQLHSPHSTASLLLLHIIIKLFISFMASNQKTVNLAMKNLSIDCLSSICSRYAQLFSEKEEVLEELQKTFSAIEEAEKQPVKEKGKKKKDKNKDKDKEKQEPPVADHTTIVTRIWPCLVEYFNVEGLEKEKTLLASLWIKYGYFTENEKRQEDFFEKLNSKKKVGMSDTGEESIDISTAALCIQYMEFGHFTTNQRLFDLALANITALFSGSTNTAQKSRAMKCMTNILTSSSIENATTLLTRPDLQNAMKSALGDPSTSVREATVDLIGRFVLQSKDENLCEQYCDIISERIMDTGISVRKRVIKILRDFSFEFPQFKKCGEIAAKIVKRINDEGEGIRKLVVESCRELWFSNVNTATIKYKMNSMIHVIETMMKTQDSNMDSMQNLFDQLIKDETVEVAGMICDLIVEEFLLDDKSDSKVTLLAAIHCLAMIAHCEPLLVAKHCNVLQSFMSLQFENRVYQMIVIKVIQTIELLLPHMKNPSSSLLGRIEEELIKNMLVRTHQIVIQPTLKCLAVLVRFHTKNTKNVLDIFEKYKKMLLEAHEKRTLHPSNVVNPKVARSIYTCGFFIKYFHAELVDSVDIVRQTSMEIVESNYDPSTRRYAINALGLIIDADPKMCLLYDVKTLFTKILTHTYTNNQALDELFCNQVLDNFKSYLSESIECDADAVKKIEWAQESLKKMQSEDDLGSTQSQIIQIFLSHILVNALNPNLQIRRSACSVINVIHSGGHVHPLQLVPHLIAITCDDDRVNRTRADHVLLEIERKYSGFTAMKAKEAINLSALFCQKLKCPGFRVYQESVASGPTSDGAVVSTTFTKEVCARMTSLYKTISTTKQNRRGFVTGLLRHFDAAEVQKDLASEMNGETSKEKAITLEFLLENILFFPYSVVDEIMYILNVLECTNSINATNITQLFKEIIQVERPPQEELDSYKAQEKCYKEYQQTLEHMQQKAQQLHQTLMQQQQYYGNYSQETYQQYMQADQQAKMLKQQPILPPTKPEVTDLEEIDLDNEEHQKKWADKIHVNMTILFNSNEKYYSLKASLKAVYFTTILRVLLKEIYVLKDEKISEYSSNDTKAWEKPVHRRTVDSTHFHEVLQTALPQLPPSILEVENLRDVENQILEEWKRFRSVSIHNVDPCFKSSMLAKLFSTKGTNVSAPTQATTSVGTESPHDGGGSEMSTPVKQNRSMHQQQTPTTPITPSKKHKSSKKKKDKKKRKRVVVSSDDDADSSEEEEDDDYDDY